MNRIITIAIAGVIAIGLFIGLSSAQELRESPTKSANAADSFSVLTKLNEAKEIKLKIKAALEDKVTITIDGEEIGEARGKDIHSFGSAYSLYSLDGDLVGSWVKNAKLIPGDAQLLDWKNEPTGEWVESSGILKDTLTLVDDQGVEVAQAEKHSLRLSFVINDLDGEDQFQLKKSWDGSKMTITRLVEKPSIDAIDALWLALIV